MLSERSHKNYILHTTQFLLCKIARTVKSIDGCIGLGGIGGWRLIYLNSMGFLFGGNKNILKLTVVVIVAQICEYTRNY